MITNRQMILENFMSSTADLVIVDTANNEYGYPVSSVNYNYAVVYKLWQVGQVYVKHDIVMAENSLYYVVASDLQPSTTQPLNSSVYMNFETSDGIVWRKYAVPYNTYELGSSLYACVLNSIVNTPQVNSVQSVNALVSDVSTHNNLGFLTSTGVGAVAIKGDTHVYTTVGGAYYKPYDLFVTSNTTNGTGFVGSAVITAGSVTSVTIVSGGTGYQQGSLVFVTGDGTGASGTCTVDVTGTITAISVVLGGGDYSVADVYVTQPDAVTYDIELEPTNGIGYDVLNLLNVDYYIIIDKTVELLTPVTTKAIKLCKTKRNTAEEYVSYSVSTVNEVVLQDTQQLKYTIRFASQ